MQGNAKRQLSTAGGGNVQNLCPLLIESSGLTWPVQFMSPASHRQLNNAVVVHANADPRNLLSDFKQFKLDKEQSLLATVSVVSQLPARLID